MPTDQIRELATPELALALLQTLVKGDTINANSSFRGAEQAWKFNGEPDVEFLLSRLSDAWAWLEAYGLIGPAVSSTTPAWQRVTSADRELADDTAAIARVWASERLAGSLDLALEEKIRPVFNLGDYETACLAAMKVVEVEVRYAAALDATVLGVNLMRQAFKPDGGPLADPGADPGERVALMALLGQLRPSPVAAAAVLLQADESPSDARRAPTRAAWLSVT